VVAVAAAAAEAATSPASAPPPRSPPWRRARRGASPCGIDEALALLDVPLIGRTLPAGAGRGGGSGCGGGAARPAPLTRPAIIDRVPAPAGPTLPAGVFTARRDGDGDGGADGGPGAARPREERFYEPVRRKADRAALPGAECSDCAAFYLACERWGTAAAAAAAGLNARPCARHGDGAGAGGAPPLLSRPALVDAASRHRARWAPPPTPAGFWDMGFMDSHDSRVVLPEVRGGGDGGAQPASPSDARGGGEEERRRRR